MKPEPVRYPLWPATPPLWNPAKPTPYPHLAFYPAGDGIHPCLAVFPGGGYNMLAAHEGEGYARYWNTKGWHAAVVHYRTQHADTPAPLREGPLFDAMRALRMLRSQAREFELDPSRIAAIGSSAGGHLAASLAVHGGTVAAPPDDDLAAVRSTPDALVLCYAVIAAGAAAHTGSFRNLCGDPIAEKALTAFFSLEQHVTRATPPTFLWHTVEDETVPVENTLCFAEALRIAARPFSLHVFPEGRHGLGLAPETPGVCAWPQLASEWLNRVLQ